MKKCFLTLAIAMLNLSIIFSQDFTIGVIPDIQKMTRDNTVVTRLYAEMQYFVDNRSKLNLQFVCSLGDMTDYGYNGYQSPHADWQRAKNASNIIRNAGIPYAVCIGNHDMDYAPCMDKPELALTRFMSYYPVSEFEGTPTFGGYFRNMANAYYLFSASGMDFIIVALQNHDEYAYYDLTSIEWANNILDQYSNRRAILITHDILRSKAKLVPDIIKKHDNLFLVCGGHVGDREVQWTETTPNGNIVNCIVTDYQHDANKGATIRYYTFKPAESKVYAYTYNTYDKIFETDANSQFSFNYPMAVKPPVTIPGKIEAENYSSMSGIQTEVTTDDGGGYNVGWTDAKDWMAYAISVPKAGTYKVSYRVASLNGGGALNLQKDAGATTLGSISVPTTGGWQKWITISHNVTLPAGNYDLGVAIATGGFNLNWIEIGGEPIVPITSVSLSPNPASVNAGSNVQLIPAIAPSNASNKALDWFTSDATIATVDANGIVSGLKAGSVTISAKTKDGSNITATSTVTVSAISSILIQAESYAQMSGVQLEATTDEGGGQNVGWLDANDWMTYANITIPSTGTYVIEYRVASLNGGGRIQIEKGGGAVVYGSLVVPSTGGWQSWTTIKHNISLQAGVQTIALKALAGGFNINWFKVTGSALKSGAAESISSRLSDSENLNESSFDFYPNPVVDHLILKVNGDNNYSVSIYNLSGKLVKNINLLKSNSETRLDMNKLSSGIYFMKVTNGTNSFVEKIIKK